VRVAVTGSSGKLGSATVERLRADGHEVVGFDRDGRPGTGFVRVDLADYGQVLDSLLGVTARHDGLDAVVHLAAIPVNGLVPDAATFHNNVTVTFNVLHAALRAGIRSIVMASSITAMGFPFDEPPPYLPVDEDVTLANNTYGLGKVVEEAMAAQLVRWYPDLRLTALRFTNVVAPGEYDTFARASDPAYRRSLLFSYVDARDGAAAVAQSLSHPETGLRVLAIAAPDTGSAIPTAELVTSQFPGVPIRRPLGEFETLVSIDRARERIGYAPTHLWRDEYAGSVEA
jgi:nucleoside-diphosphate-sugar epimerase